MSADRFDKHSSHIQTEFDMYKCYNMVQVGICSQTCFLSLGGFRVDVFVDPSPLLPLHADVILYLSQLHPFHSASVEKGLRLSIPIISAGSFGISCDYALNLQRLLPPARKISNFFIHFWLNNNKIKPQWKTAYIYKKDSNTEDCFW